MRNNNCSGTALTFYSIRQNTLSACILTLYQSFKTNFEWIHLRAFAKERIFVCETCFGMLENIAGIGENAGLFPAFSFFSHNVFKRLLPHGRYLSRLCGNELSCTS